MIHHSNPSANDLTKSVLSICSAYSVNAWRQNNVRAVKGRTFTGKKGVPDVIGFTKKGKFLGVEIKAGKDKLSPEQKQFHEDLKEKGGISVIIRTYEDVKKLERLIQA